MRIGLIAPPWVPVPPVGYGGTEGVIDGLARGLTARGHDVRLFTVGESTCPVRCQWLFEHPPEPMNEALPEAAHVLAAYEALLGDVDVIHDHTTLGPALVAGRSAASTPATALVATVHMPFGPAALRLFRAVPRRVAVVCISRDQRASADGVAVAAVIHHGIDTDLHAVGPGGGGYLVFVGRMSPDKGPDRAIRVARAAGLPLVLMAKCRGAEERAYYAAEVQPLLGPDVTTAGELAPAERVAVLQRAEGLLMPITWPEPFGLVMPEALACGTPVVAYRSGAAPEIVEDGVTGFLVGDEAEMTDAVRRLPGIDRAACREAAVRRFSLARMAADHDGLYRRLLASGDPVPVDPGPVDPEPLDPGPLDPAPLDPLDVTELDAPVGTAGPAVEHHVLARGTHL